MVRSEGDVITVGDRITVHRGREHRITVRTVVATTKTQFTDNTGERWVRYWMQPVEAGTWGHTFCKPYAPEHDAQIAERNEEVRQREARNYLTAEDWRELPQEVVDQVYAIVRKARASAEARGKEQSDG